MSIWRNLGKILDARPPHNWDYDVEGVRFCTVCQISYSGETNHCSGADYAVRKGLPIRQVRKPEQAKNDQQYQQEQAHREREQREKRQREREQIEKRQREDREKRERENREREERENFEREKRERQKLDREMWEREREEEAQERRQKRMRDQQIQRRREALELRQLQMREAELNMKQRHREPHRRVPQQIHYDYQQVNQFNERRSQLPRVNHHESNISPGSRHEQQNIFRDNQSQRSEQVQRCSQRINDRGSRVSGRQSSYLSEASIREDLQIYLCPIDLHLMEDPWAIPCGHTFQKKAILRHLQTSDRCPVCKLPFDRSQMHQDILAKMQIENKKRRLERHNIDINDYL